MQLDEFSEEKRIGAYCTVYADADASACDCEDKDGERNANIAAIAGKARYLYSIELHPVGFSLLGSLYPKGDTHVPGENR